ncbi:unnamed protein product [Bursaphelenchus xylophilus]|uniref:(pine wood nematode) hypothetical protein n=1 Tax=Bursaphelenchus xylophilus TaxID=6326 RepID=A0A1I7RKS2_BURXY|nr:unnamed protein product [Bursaphelenchus xylophilus]CAG9131120.1 unnamed protein product [Bursaphelenchus xylophilus]
MDKSLFGLIEPLKGRRIIFELVNEASVDGILLATSKKGFKLGNTRIYTSQKEDEAPVSCWDCFVIKSRVRFIHFPRNISLYKIQKELMECPV